MGTAASTRRAADRPPGVTGPSGVTRVTGRTDLGHAPPAAPASGARTRTAAAMLPARPTGAAPRQPLRAALLALALAGTAVPASAQASPSAAAPPAAAQPAPRPAARATAPRPAGCLIEPDQVADVGSPVTGVLEHIGVDRGDAVTAGQTLAVLRGEVERAQAGVAEARARVDADVRAAAASLALAQQKVVRARQLLAQQFVSQQALDQAQAEADVAAERLAQARSQQAISQRERDAALAQLGQRTLRSPLSGIVVERYAHPGERVEDRPVLRVARIDPLRVELMVPVAQYGLLRPGDRVAIRPELPGNPVLSATVRLVDKVVDPASNTYRVRLALPNPDQRLPAGLRCRADLPPSAAAAAPAGVQPAAASAFQPTTQPALQPAARRALPPAIQPATQRTAPPAAGPATPIPAPAAVPHSAQPGAAPVPGGPAGLRMSPLLRLPGARPATPQVPQV